MHAKVVGYIFKYAPFRDAWEEACAETKAAATSKGADEADFLRQCTSAAKSQFHSEMPNM